MTGRTQLSLVSEAQEVQLGRQSAEQVSQQLGLVPDSALQAYVQRIGGTLAAASERPNLPWTFRVVDDATPNAFALPGGYIFVTRGMLNLMTSEAEPPVLGHEIGRHPKHQVPDSRGSSRRGVGLGSGWCQVRAWEGWPTTAAAIFLVQPDAERQQTLGFSYARASATRTGDGDVFASGSARNQSGRRKTGRSPSQHILAPASPPASPT